MGWRAIHKSGEQFSEDKDGRPVQAGEEGNLLVILQEDYGHKVAIDLVSGIISLEYDDCIFQNGQVEIQNPKTRFWICDETSLASDMFHLKQELVDFRNEAGDLVRGSDYQRVKVRNDILTPLIWRPIWFTRNIIPSNGPVKVIGAQTTLPVETGGKNIKKLLSLFPDGRIGID